MPHNPLRRSTATIIALWLVATYITPHLGCSKAPAEQAIELPRYQFQVGQQLVYEGDKSLSYGNEKSSSTTKWTVYVTRQNDDQSWRLVFFGSEQAQSSRHAPEEISLAYCDMFADGRVVENPTLGFDFDPAEMFPRLPNDRAAAAKGWETHNRTTDVTTRYRLVPDAEVAAGRWLIEAEKSSPIDDVYLSSSRSIYEFVSSQGLAEQIKTENSQDFGMHAKGQGGLGLRSVEPQEPKTIETLGREMDVYFQASESNTTLVRRAMTDPMQAEALLTKATESLQAALDQVSLPFIKQNLTETLEGLTASRSHIVQSALQRTALVGQQGADWEAADLDGRMHSSEQYRGKVVVLDFWFRGCSWCIRGMGQIKQLASDFKGQPVAVLGMNTDEDVEDAKFVVEKLGLNYPNLRAQGIPEKYDVTGFPMLVVIDQSGTVRNVHIGYSPTLYEDISADVKDLLKGG